MYNNLVYVKDRDKQILRFIEEHGSITLNMASKIFYKGHKFAYPEARRRMKKIAELFNIRHTQSKFNKEYIFYRDKPISPHSIFVLNFYAELVNHGCENIVFRKGDKSRVWTLQRPRSDAFFEFIYNDQLYLILLEVDFTHKCSLQNYEKLFESGELQEMYKHYKNDENDKDIFPKVVVITDVLPTKPYRSENFEVVFLEYNLDNFAKKVLA